MPRIKAATLMLSLATLSVPALAQGTDPAVRDNSLSALNYVQGSATLDGRAVTTNPNMAPRRLHAGETVSTADGSADIMLAPGSLLRVGQGTQVDLVASTGNRAEVRIQSGRANLAVNMVRPGTLLLVDLPNGQTQVLQRGLYTFDTSSETVKVFNGEADVFPGANTETDAKPVKVKDEHAAVLTEGRVKPVKFDRMQEQGELLPWTGPQEAHADGDYGMQANAGNNYGDGGYQTVGYGYGPGPYAFGVGYGYPGYGYGLGWGYPYGFYGYPYGFYGYPFGVGIGFGYGGFYRGGFYGRGVGYGGYGYRGGVVGAGRGFGGGGFGGGGFHGGGGGGRR